MAKTYLTRQMLAYECACLLGNMFSGKYKSEATVCLFCRSVKDGRVCTNCGAGESEILNLKPILLPPEETTQPIYRVIFPVMFDDLLMSMDRFSELLLRGPVTLLHSEIVKVCGRLGHNERLAFRRIRPDPLSVVGWSVAAYDEDLGVSIQLDYAGGQMTLMAACGVIQVEDNKLMVERSVA